MVAVWVSALLGCTDGNADSPSWLAVPDEAASGAWLWGVVDRPPERLNVRLDGIPLAVDQMAGPGVTWRLPLLAPGTYTLELHLTGSVGPGTRTDLTLHAPDFVEVAADIGLDFVHDVQGWDPLCAESLTAIALADWDLDGDLDAFAGNLMADSVAWTATAGEPGGLPHFDEATAELGLDGIDLVSAASFADFDSDGDPNLLVGRRGANLLLENRLVPDGEARFVDVSERLPPSEEARTTGAAWGDLDGDADLDVYLTNHHWCFPGPGGEALSSDVLLRNDGEVFANLTGGLDDSLGQISDRLGFAALWIDLDDDHDQDLVVANDAVGRRAGNAVWRNVGAAAPAGLEPWLESGIDVASDALGKGPNAMGMDVADVDHDGRPDFAFSNIGPSLLVLSDDDGAWTEAAGPAGVQRTVHPWGEQALTWGVHLFDRDLDGDVDLFVVGGALKGNKPQPHGLFDNRGDGTFVDHTWTSGLASPGHQKGSAIADLDGDGLLDVLVATWGGALEVWHNRSLDGVEPRPHHLVVDLVGDGTEVARDAFGARVEVEADGQTWTCWRTPRPSLAGTGDPACHFGLGGADRVDALTVIWPDGRVDEVAPPDVDQRISVSR